MNNCESCDYARYSPIQNMICCGLFSSIKHGFNSDITCPHCGETMLETNIDNALQCTQFRDEENIYSGWGGLHCKTKEQCHLLTNDCVIVDKDNWCTNYKQN